MVACALVTLIEVFFESGNCDIHRLQVISSVPHNLPLNDLIAFTLYVWPVPVS